MSVHDYTADLLRHLGDAAGASQREIVVLADVDRIEAPLEVAVPFGLLVTELVSNSLKHGFRPGHGGSIHVSLKRRDNQVWLTVRDNGLGLSAGIGGAVFTAKLERMA